LQQPAHTRRITAKTVFAISLIVAILTILAIWLFGLGRHRTVFQNSILSTTILSAAFFLFISIGLYKGIKLQNDWKPARDDANSLGGGHMADIGTDAGFLETVHDPEGIIVSLILWFVVSVLLGVFLWFFSTVLWTGILAFMAMLYWIFFRALRLVFKNRGKCRGNLSKSFLYGLMYTLLYTSWIYGVIVGVHYFFPK
jgi:hypothetical protein